MRLTISRETFLKTLAKVMGVVGRGTDLFNKPILGNVLVRIANGKLAITASDLEVEITADTMVPDAPVGASGDVTLPARKLADILRALPEDCRLDLSVKQDAATLTTTGSRYVLKTLPVADFPLAQVPQAERHVSIPAKELAIAMRRCSHAMGYQDARIFLNALLIEIKDGNFNCVASDGHRMAIARTAAAAGTKDQRVLIPRKAAEELLPIVERADGEIRLDVSAKHLRVATDGLTFQTQLVDALFPDYAALVPPYAGGDIIIQRQPLIDAIERVDILADEHHHAVGIDVSPNAVKVHGKNKTKEDAVDALDAKTQIDAMTVGFNAKYLLDALRAVPTDDVRMCLRGNGQSLVMTPVMEDPNLTQVIMPVRL